MNAGVLPNTVKLFHKLGREDSIERLGESLPARQGIHHFHLRVPALDAVLHVERHDAYVDGFDDILVEILEALVLSNFLLQRGIELCVLDRNAKVSTERLQEFDVFAGEEVPLRGFSQAQNGNRFLLHATRNVVVEIQPSDGFPRARSFARHLMRVLEE